MPHAGTTLAILGYHKIGEPPPDGWETWFYIPEATFAAHLAYLREHGWQVIDLAAFLRALSDPRGLPERAALITFDDGYRSILSGALRWLRRFDYPAVLFMPTDYIGDHNRFDLESEPEEPLCTWQDLRLLERQGVAVQSHGAGHRAMSELTPAEQRDEMARSKAVLEAGLERPVEVFSFPYGDNGTNPAELETTLAELGYRAACLYGDKPVRLPTTQPFRLERVALGPDSDLETELA
jgi:peptidoglycan/xylan/chitin deacetylase (PgdA/CDA1 family)